MNDVAPQKAPPESPKQATLRLNRDQVLDAMGRLDVNPATLPRLPWDSVHEVVGPVWPTDIWIVAAATGNGKTTAAAHIVEAWLKAGKRIYFHSLEQKPAELRTALAALANDLHPQRCLENRWDRLPKGAKDTLRATLRAQIVDLEGRLVFAAAEPALSLETLEREMVLAYDLHADMVVIDHVHHVELGGGNAHQALVRFCQVLKRLVNETEIPVLLLAQLHRGEKDPIAPFQPPNPYSIQGGEVLRQVSSVALGLYRPLVETFDAEDARQVRTGKRKIGAFLEPNAMSVHVMKHRLRGGEAYGELIHLTYDHGRISCPITEARLREEVRYDL